jgi:hypothetical protein
MSRWLLRKIVGVGVASVVLVTHRAWGATPLDVPIEYTAPSECLDGASFEKHLAELPPSSSSAGEPRSVTVVVRRARGGFSGSVRVDYRDGTSTERKVASARCDDLTAALEFVAALAMGLEARRQEPAAVPPPPKPTAVVQAPPSSPAPHWRFGATLRAAGMNAVGPNVRLGLEGGAVATFERQGFISPEFRLEGLGASGSATSVLGTANLTLLTSVIEACPVLVRFGDVDVRPCVGAQVGALRGVGRGSSLVEGDDVTRFWFAGLLLGRIEWNLGRFVAVEADGGAVVPARRERYYFGPDSTLYEVPVVTGLASLGLKVALP